MIPTPTSSRRKTLYLDLVGGASGDMLLAALVDAGASLDVVRAAVSSVGLHDVAFETKVAYPAGLRARQIEVRVRGMLADDHAEASDHDHDHHHDPTHAHHHPHSSGHRPYRVIRERIADAALDPRVSSLALDAFRRLADAEGRVHGVDPEDVEFHEVGSDDAIADIVGVAAAVADLGIDHAVASPVPIGRGRASSAHGAIPLPAPAVLELLLGVPIEETPLVGETITPTGAALLRALSSGFGPAPSMVLERTGVGAGKRTWPDRPNVVRAFVGHSGKETSFETIEDCVVETNIDNMNPEHFSSLERALFEAGAVDVWCAPVQMKKNRLGVVVSALVAGKLRSLIIDVFFLHSTTLGVRVSTVARFRGARRMEEVATRFGRVRVKISDRPKGPPLCAPECEDVERLAREHGASIRVVSEAALLAAWRLLERETPARETPEREA